jgi:hypothetical protein
MSSLEELIASARNYAKLLNGVSDEQLERMEEETRKQEMGVESFAAEMFQAAEEDRRDLARWAVGTKTPVASPEKITAIYSELFPQHVLVNEDALGLIRLKEEKRFPEIDEVCSDICTAITRRLPRTLNGYRYVDDEAEDVLEVPNIGKIKVKLNDTGGIFRFVRTVEGKTVKIWNCRQTGRQYMKIYNDTSLPNDVTIFPLDLVIQLYSDDSGIYFDKPKETFGKHHRKITQETWESEKEKIASWLKKNVLNNILLLPENPNQIDKPPKAIPYPEGLGELYTWIRTKDAAKLLLTGYDPSKVYPHERVATSPNSRLISWDIHGDYPEEANRGFIYCTPDVETAHKYRREVKIHVPGTLSEGHVLTKVKPKDGEEIFVVNYQVWDDYRKQVFSDPSKGRMNNEEYSEMHARLGRTLIPISRYKGGYKQPVVLIGRDLEFNEVEVIPSVQYKPR